MYGYKIFHENLMNNLLQTVRDGSTSHAYIFNAAGGMFPEEAATLFASALTCLDSAVVPCGSCRSCVEAKARTNPDIIYADVPNGKKTIDVETVRHICEDAIKKPFNAPRKVYIIKNGDTMTPAAQNAFLKTFEEPPEHDVFIILAENTDKLLPTIISRGEVIEFAPLPRRVVRKYIEEKYPQASERLDFLSNYCEGVPGRADEIIENPEFETMRTEALKMLPKLLGKNKTDAFSIEKFIRENTDSADLIFEFWISYLRDALVFACGDFDSCINSDKAKALMRLSGEYDARQISEALDILARGKEMLGRYVKPSAAALRCALKTAYSGTASRSLF